MSYKELKDMVLNLDSTNVEELKTNILRKVNELIVNISDDNITNDELENLSKVIVTKESLRNDYKKDNLLVESLLIENFINAFEDFINEINNEEYISDTIELINHCLKSIGGLARGCRIIRKYSDSQDYNTMNHLNELKDEFYNQLKSFSTKGIHEEQLVIFGLIRVVKFELEEKLQEHGKSVISLLTNHKTQKGDVTIDEFKNKSHIDELRFKVNKEYAEELQKRIYLWDKLTLQLQDHYYLEKLYDEANEE